MRSQSLRRCNEPYRGDALRCGGVACGLAGLAWAIRGINLAVVMVVTIAKIQIPVEHESIWL